MQYAAALIICLLTLLHSERPKLYGVLAVLSAIGLKSGVEVEDVGKGLNWPEKNKDKEFFIRKSYSLGHIWHF